MALLLNTGDITVAKHKTSGIVALCAEVTEYVNTGEAAQDNVLVDQAYYEESGDWIHVVFPRST